MERVKSRRQTGAETEQLDLLQVAIGFGFIFMESKKNNRLISLQRGEGILSSWGELMVNRSLLSKVQATSLTTGIPENLSVGRRWKFRRNLVIYVASQNGVSQRLLADVFDLPHSRIAAIIKEFRTKYTG